MMSERFWRNSLKHTGTGSIFPLLLSGYDTGFVNGNNRILSSTLNGSIMSYMNYSLKVNIFSVTLLFNSQTFKHGYNRIKYFFTYTELKTT